MQAEQCHLIWPSATPFWLGTRRICLTRASGFTFFDEGERVPTYGDGQAHPRARLRRHPSIAEFGKDLFSATAGEFGECGRRCPVGWH